MKTERRELTATESSRPGLRSAIAREEICHHFRLLATMSEGVPSVLPEARRSYRNVDDARRAASQMMDDPRVFRITIVENRPPLRFIEYVGR